MFCFDAAIHTGGERCCGTHYFEIELGIKELSHF